VKRFVVVLLSAGLLLAELPAGSRLPELKGEFLSGRKAVLPEAAAGRVTLLAIGFSYESRFPVESWIKRFRGDFGTTSGTGFFEVPMIGGMGRMGKWFIDSGMRHGTPKEDYEHVITVFGNTDKWKQRVGYAAPNAAYLVLLDKEGKVQWQHSAGLLEASEEASYQGLATMVRSLVAK
jgi:hypothetical protein